MQWSGCSVDTKKDSMNIRILFLLSFCLLPACTPREQAFTPPVHPPEITANTFHPSDDISLPLRHWKTGAEPKAIIIALHGFNDYSHAFEGAAYYFAGRGIETYAYDQRGFGAAHEHGIWAGEENLVSDAEQMAHAVHARHPHVPIFLLGESMGGAIAVEALAHDSLSVSGVILSAPAVWDLNVFLRVPLWLGAHTVPWHELTGENLDVQASDNVPMLRALRRDPLVLKSARIDALYGLAHLMDAANSDAEKLRAPVLLLYGAHDEIIPPDPVHDFAARLRVPHRIITYPGGWHLLLRDLQAKRVEKDVADWVLKQENPRP